MMATQVARRLKVRTVLGEDGLLLTRLWGSESLSKPYLFQLDVLSESPQISRAELVGTPVSVSVDDLREGEPRYFHGLVSEFTTRGWSRCGRFREYMVEVRPWLWFLTHSSDCRIFQHKTVPQILEEVFRAAGFTDASFERLRRSYAPREYCVQYRETDFNFVSRLMEEEGIFYAFRQTADRHELVLFDSAIYPECGQPEIRVRVNDGRVYTEETIAEWEHTRKIATGAWSYRDFNFEDPRVTLDASVPALRPAPLASRFERYDYPGAYLDRDRGRQLAKLRVEHEEAGADIVSGRSDCRMLVPGDQFKLRESMDAADNGQPFVVLAVHHSAEETANYEGVPGDSETEEKFEYGNSFECFGASTVYRPPQLARKARVEGPQTAYVVGPPGEEIYTDPHGRVKLHFHWDRLGPRDENSSCWVRVSHNHGGRGWGGIDLPRIGEEVIVDFLEGDPDRPIVTGRVYNAVNKPPFSLPGEKTRSGIKSQTYKGTGFNEISMDDTAGQEQIRVHGQHNLDAVVGNNETRQVGVDRATKIGNDETEEVGNNQTIKIGNNQVVDVGVNQSVRAGQNILIDARTSITLRCGASMIHMNQAGFIRITGTVIAVAAKINASVSAPITNITGAALLTNVGGVVEVAGGLTQVRGGKVDVLSAGPLVEKGTPITLN